MRSRCFRKNAYVSAGRFFDTSRSTQPMALRMKNSRSSSIPAARRDQSTKSPRPPRRASCSARSAARRTQKLSSFAHFTRCRRERASRTMTSPITFGEEPIDVGPTVGTAHELDEPRKVAADERLAVAFMDADRRSAQLVHVGRVEGLGDRAKLGPTEIGMRAAKPPDGRPDRRKVGAHAPEPK